MLCEAWRLGEIRALFLACAADRAREGARDAALLALLYGAGLRRAEAVALDLADYQPDTGELRIRNGKGAKDRLEYLTNGAREAVDGWLAVRGNDPGAFLIQTRRRSASCTPLGAQAVYAACRKRARQAGVSPFSPHDLRRSFVGDMLDAGADVVTVQASRDTPTSRPRPDTIAAGKRPNAARPSCCTSPSRDERADRGRRCWQM